MSARRSLLWLLLAAAVLAVLVAFFMAPRWVAERQGLEPLPVLGEIGGLELVDATGAAIGLDDLAGQPWVADLIFTRCALSCPRMTRQMQRLRSLVPAPVGFRRVSISVDPEHDTPEVLAAYAVRQEAVADDWLFLTGEREAIRRLAFEELRIGFDDAPPPEMASPLEPIVHSTRFVLVDAAARVRGYYDPFEGSGLAQLARDVSRLAAEVSQ